MHQSSRDLLRRGSNLSRVAESRAASERRYACGTHLNWQSKGRDPHALLARHVARSPPSLVQGHSRSRCRNRNYAPRRLPDSPSPLVASCSTLSMETASIALGVRRKTGGRWLPAETSSIAASVRLPASPSCASRALGRPKSLWKTDFSRLRRWPAEAHIRDAWGDAPP